MSRSVSRIRAAYRSLRDHRTRIRAGRNLAAMEDAFLKDIGISRAEIHYSFARRSRNDPQGAAVLPHERFRHEIPSLERVAGEEDFRMQDNGTLASHHTLHAGLARVHRAELLPGTVLYAWPGGRPAHVATEARPADRFLTTELGRCAHTLSQYSGAYCSRLRCVFAANTSGGHPSVTAGSPLEHAMNTAGLRKDRSSDGPSPAGMC